MKSFKIFLLLSLCCFLTGCYNQEITILLSPDGSGTVTYASHFDRATFEQREQLRKFLQSENVTTSYSKEKLVKVFPEPHFKILEMVEDRENLQFRTVIKFTDINRLLAVDADNYQLNGLDFSVEDGEVVFSVKRPEGPAFDNMRLKAAMQETLLPVHRIKILASGLDERVEFVHEYTGDENHLVDWEGRLNIPRHTIQRRVIKFNLPDYPELPGVEARILKAEWVRYKSRFHHPSFLNLELGVPVPQSKEYSYLNWNEPLVLEGKFADGTAVVLTKEAERLSEGFDGSGGESGWFKIPLKIVFPDHKVGALTPLKLRLRLTRSSNVTRAELGTLQPNQTYPLSSFSVTTGELKDNSLTLKLEGNRSQIKQVLAKTARGNLFALESASWSGFENSWTMSYWPLFSFSDVSVFVDYYRDVENCWLDVMVPNLDLALPTAADTSADPSWQDALAKILPGEDLSILPELPKDVLLNLDKLESYMTKVPDERILAHLIQLSLQIKTFKNTYKIYSWYQLGLAKEIKSRPEYFSEYREKIARTLFALYTNLPWQDQNTAIVYLLVNLGVVDDVREDALRALKSKELNHEVPKFFPGTLSSEEREVLRVMYRLSSNWMEKKGLLQRLVQGPDGDLDMAWEVLYDASESEFVRVAALEEIVKREEKSRGKLLQQFIADAKMRQQTLQILGNLIQTKGREIGGVRFLQSLAPVKPLLQDLSGQLDEWKRERAAETLQMLEAAGI